MAGKTQILPVVTEEAFAKMSPAAKRVAVAEDVLAQLKAKRVKAKNAVWADISFLPTTSRSLQNILNTEQSLECHACGLGACFLSIVRIQNQFDISASDATSGRAFPGWVPTGTCGSKFRRITTAVLGKRNWVLIEAAFELGENFKRGNKEMIKSRVSLSNFDAAVRFGNKYRSARGRLIAIMQNIIDNEGTFKP